VDPLNYVEKGEQKSPLQQIAEGIDVSFNGSIEIEFVSSSLLTIKIKRFSWSIKSRQVSLLQPKLDAKAKRHEQEENYSLGDIQWKKGEEGLGKQRCPNQDREEYQGPIENAHHQERTYQSTSNIEIPCDGFCVDIQRTQQRDGQVHTGEETGDGHSKPLDKDSQEDACKAQDCTGSDIHPGILARDEHLGNLDAGYKTNGCYKQPEEFTPP
jgi:hypothetical protein